MRNYALAAAALFLAAGCSTASVGTGTPAPPPPAGSAVVPAGTTMEVELEQTLSTRSNEVGDRFTATVKEPVRTADGNILVPEDAVVHGVITGLDDSDDAGDQAAIRLNFDRITINGRSYPFSADITATDVDIDDLARIGDVQRKAGIGAAAGAVLGAVIGGDLKDILIGGVLGAGVGTIISLGMGDFEAALPAGSDLTLRTTQHVSLR